MSCDRLCKYDIIDLHFSTSCQSLITVIKKSTSFNYLLWGVCSFRRSIVMNNIVIITVKVFLFPSIEGCPPSRSRILFPAE